MIKIYSNQDDLIFKDAHDDSFMKQYPANSIKLIKYDYFDDSEESLLLIVYLREQFENIVGGFTTYSEDLILEKVKEYENIAGWVDRENKFEFYSEEGNDITQTILSITEFCTLNNIYLLQPNNTDSMFSKFVDFKKQQEVIEWWKDDVVFRAFSKN